MKAWRCVICGYVHRGDEPPNECPVCGAPRSDFEESPEEAPAKKILPARQWRCLVCGYIHDGDAPPAECPLCAATSDSFEPVATPSDEPAATSPARRIVILGGGIAGVAAAESARKTAPDAAITLVAREAELPYYRINLTRLLAGEIDESSLPIHPAAWYSENRIEWIGGAEAEAVSLADKTVRLAGARTVAFDRLVLATGAHPFVPPLPGAGLEGVRVLRTLQDARDLLAKAEKGARCVCIGGGILGLETAGALARRGASVTLLESHGYLMPRQLCRGAGEVLASHVLQLGIRLIRNARTKQILGERAAAGVLLEDGQNLPADVVVVATGVRSNTHLARSMGLEVNQGIVVDNTLATSHRDVYAAGDAAEHNGILYGSWYAAQYQGAIAGRNAGGAATEFGGIPRSHTLKILGLGMTSVGTFEPADGSYRVVEDQPAGGFRRFVFRDAKLVGAILLGDTSLASAVSRAIEGETDFSGLLIEKADASSMAATLGDRS